MLLGFAKEFHRIYNENNVPRSAAALTYYLTMTFFPLLICLYTLLGSSYDKAMEVLDFTRHLMAAETAAAIEDFLAYVAANNNKAMMLAALFVLLTSASAAERSLHATIGEMQGKQRFRGLMGFAFSIVFSLILVAAIYLATILMLSGGSFLQWLNGVLPILHIGGSWRILRFFLLAGIVNVIVWAIYKVSQRRDDRYPTHLGAVLATLAMVGVSIVFSGFISASNRYPLVYGSLASVILLMLWLYTSCLVIYCGAAFNIALRNRGSDVPEQRQPPDAEEK